MTIDTSFTVKKLKSLETIFVAFSGATRIPYIECDEETYDDQAYLFSSDEAARDFAKRYQEKNHPIILAKVPGKGAPQLFIQLYSVNVNAIMFHDGITTHRIQLNEIFPEPDWEKVRAEKLPMMNPSLSLPTIYFLEELRRPNMKADDAERMQKVRELKEEMIANLVKSRFVLTFELVEQIGEGGVKETKARIPFVKSKNGTIYQPLFSCMPEVQRFVGANPDKKTNLRLVTFQELPKFLAPESKGFAMDPSSLNLILSKEHIERLVKQFPAEEE